MLALKSAVVGHFRAISMSTMMHFSISLTQGEDSLPNNSDAVSSSVNNVANYKDTLL